MKTLKLKIAQNGMLCPCHPLAPTGNHAALIYQINNVPDELPINVVVLHLNKIILAHSIDGPVDDWIYDWDVIGKLPAGSIVNRYHVMPRSARDAFPRWSVGTINSHAGAWERSTLERGNDQRWSVGTIK